MDLLLSLTSNFSVGTWDLLTVGPTISKSKPSNLILSTLSGISMNSSNRETVLKIYHVPVDVIYPTVTTATLQVRLWAKLLVWRQQWFWYRNGGTHHHEIEKTPSILLVVRRIFTPEREGEELGSAGCPLPFYNGGPHHYWMLKHQIYPDYMEWYFPWEHIRKSISGAYIF